MKTLHIHYLARQAGGPIKTGRRVVRQGKEEAVICEGGEWAVACQPTRKTLSVLSRSKKRVIDHFPASGSLDVVTCPQCKKSPLYLRDAPKQERV